MMFNRVINRNVINKLSNQVFDLVNGFFTGSQKLQNPSINDEHFSHPGSFNSCSLEWDLHQDVSDIVIKDISKSICWLLPSSFIIYLNKVRRQILLYFYMDVIEEEEINGVQIKMDYQAGFSTGIKRLVISHAQNLTSKLNDRVISIHEGWKSLIRKLEILLRLDNEPKTYSLIGNFSPIIYDAPDPIHCPDRSNLKPSFLFHKRN